MNLFKIFYLSCCLYQFSIYIFPLLVMDYFDIKDVKYNDDTFIYPLCFIIGIWLVGWGVSKLKFKTYYLNGFSSNKNILIFLLWIIASLVLYQTGNLTMAKIDRTAIPFLTQLKLFSSYGIIFTYYYSLKFRKNHINLLEYMFIVTIILAFAFLTLSKFIIFLNLLIILFTAVKSKKIKMLSLGIGAVYFLTVYNYLLDYRTSITNNQDVEVIQQARSSKNLEHPPAVDFILDRLNYSQIIDATKSNNVYTENSPYSSILLSLIPRIIYPNKPKVGIDTNAFGRSIGLLDSRDFITSLGIGVIGESYAHYRLNGLFAIFIYIFIFIPFILIRNISFKILMFMSFVTLDTFVYLAPMLVQVIIFGFIFSGFKNNTLIANEFSKN